jgi:hypothetical protein
MSYNNLKVLVVIGVWLLAPHGGCAHKQEKPKPPPGLRTK